MSRPLADESVYRAVAHPVRRKMLELLRIRERPGSEFLDAFQMPKQTISHHLRVLRTSGLLKQARRGRQRIYTLHAAHLRDIHRWTGEFKQLWSKANREG